jgi:tetratricopeptide (TPR) repeat protein
MHMLKFRVHSSDWIILACVAFSISLSGCTGLEKPLPGKFTGNERTSTSPAPQSTDFAAIKKLLDAGNLKAKAGQWAAAVEDFKQVLSLDSRNVQAHVQLGWSYAEQKMWDEAKGHLLSAVALDPNNAGAHANLAWVYAEKKRWQDAQEQARKAIDLDPKNAYAHATLAWAYQSSGQHDLAIAEYEKSLELNPALDNSRLALGIEYCNQGNSLRAKAQLETLKKQGATQAVELQTRISKGCGKP